MKELKQNPWIGWSSYEEDSLNEGHRFVGRINETSQLFSLIDNNLLVTIYGKSGIGKTSLLNAGVFPSLIAAGYLPIICRRGSDNNYINDIITEISKKCNIVSDVEVNSITNLVDLFRICSFKVDKKEVFPTLVFDQFEDWFRSNGDAGKTLLAAISYIVSNDYHFTTNFRIVFSIREDYLYLLEDAIDAVASPDLKENRYRLTHFHEAQAKEVLDLGKLPKVVRERLLSITKDGSGYNPGLLSFYCHEIYETTNGKITDEALKILEEETILIEKHYNQCFKKYSLVLKSLQLETERFSLSTKKYIEDSLQENGLRRPQNLKQVKEQIPEEELKKLFKGRYKLLQKFPVGDEEYVELIHDRIAEVIQRNKQQSLQDTKRRLATGFLFIYYVIVGFVTWKLLIQIKDLLVAIFKLQSDNNACEQLLQEYGAIAKESITWFLSGKFVLIIMLIYMMVIQLPFNISSYIFNAKLKALIISLIITMVIAVIIFWGLDILTLLLNIFA